MPQLESWNPLAAEHGDSTDYVVKALGLPDLRREVTVFWPDLEHVDRFFYNPTAGNGVTDVSHWRYQKYPRLVLSIEARIVKGISSDHISIPIDKNDKSSDGLRRWTIKSGSTIDASFVRLRRGMVTLKETGGNTKDAKVTDLNDGDRDYIRRKVRDSSKK